MTRIGQGALAADVRAAYWATRHGVMAVAIARQVGPRPPTGFSRHQASAAREGASSAWSDSSRGRPRPPGPGAGPSGGAG